jgi:anti-sigma-K factor RskA
MTDREEIDLLAAEYVLGTLEADERMSVAARRQRDQVLDRAIEGWERRLAPLAETVAASMPSAGLFAEIEIQIEAMQIAAAGDDRLIKLERSARGWCRLAIATAALSACLIVVVMMRERPPQRMPRSYVAIFQRDDVSPAFLLSVDLENKALSVRPVAARPQPGKNYQLWIISEQIGASPQSLGLIEDDGNVTHRIVASYDATIVEHAMFSISLEPAGGSPTGRPTGPAFHAKLIPAP